MFLAGLMRFSGSTGPSLQISGGAIARGKHLFPFRTEPLSLSAPMVLGGKLPGRVGRRRFFCWIRPPRSAGAAFSFPGCRSGRMGRRGEERPAALWTGGKAVVTSPATFRVALALERRPLTASLVAVLAEREHVDDQISGARETGRDSLVREDHARKIGVYPDGKYVICREELGVVSCGEGLRSRKASLIPQFADS